MTDKTKHINDGLPDLFCESLQKKYGDSVLAIVLYGSWLRGQRDTVIDLYVLLDSYKALN